MSIIRGGFFAESALNVIRDSWSGESVPSWRTNEYVRGQFEMAAQLLGYSGELEETMDELQERVS